jgi:hypothetical protein
VFLHREPRPEAEAATERYKEFFLNDVSINLPVYPVCVVCDFEYVFDFRRLCRCGLARVCIGSRLIGSTQWNNVLHSKTLYVFGRCACDGIIPLAVFNLRVE